MLSAKSVDEIGKISEPCVNHLHGFLGSQQKTKLILSDLDYFHVYLNQTKNTRIQTKLLRNHTWRPRTCPYSKSHLKLDGRDLQED